MLGEYCDSGYRSTRGKLRYALQSNGQFQFIMLGCGLVGCIYLFYNFGTHSLSLKATLVALAYAWGLVLAIYLMGHGLVVLPRRLIQSANTGRELGRLQMKAPQIYDKLTEARDQLRELEGRAGRLQLKKTALSSNLQVWVDELVRSSYTSEQGNATAQSSQLSYNDIPTVITANYLASLTRDLKRARHKKARFEHEWRRLVQHANDLEAILTSASNKTLVFEGSSPGSFVDLKMLNPRTRYYLHAKILPPLRLVFGILLAVASVCIILSELIKSTSHRLSIVGQSVAHGGRVTHGGQFVAAGWLLYMCTATLISITDVKVWGNRALVPRHTYPESAAWYSSQVAKLTIPLAYNFVTLLPFKNYEGIAFHHVLGRLVNFTPLGEKMTSLFPIFVLLPVLAALFGLYSKVQKFFKLGTLVDNDGDGGGGDSESGMTGLQEGRNLIERHNLECRSSMAHPESRSLPSLLEDPFVSRALQSDLRTGERQTTYAQEAYRDDATAADGDFFSEFTHRFKNTFDTVERPAWLTSLGDSFKRSRLGGADDEGSAGDSNKAFTKWFGGDSAPGALRI